MPQIISAKEKAIELYNKFRNENSAMSANIRAKKQAILCVEQIIDNFPFRDYGFSYYSISSRIDAVSEFWEQVKLELQGLS